jgi:ATP-dependent Clp protease adaptor protein ClpS
VSAARLSPAASGDTAVLEREDDLAAPVSEWITIVWDDPVNLMSYVTYVFVSYFGFPKPKAERLMLRVHREGKAVVSRGGREEMERDVRAMHEYGLLATLQRAAGGAGA